MLRLLHAIIRRPAPVVRARADVGGGSGSDGTHDARGATAARAVADALEEALIGGQTGRAARLCAAAARFQPAPARLVELRARFHLGRNEPAHALDLIDTCATHTASLQLIRIACLLRAGRRHDAHSELMGWARRAGAPLDARILLACLEWDSAAPRQATAALARNARQLDDPDAMELMGLLAVESGRNDDADAWMQRVMRRGHGGAARRTTLLARSIGCTPTCTVALDPLGEDAAHLAVALVAHEDALAALVAAQFLEPRPHTQALLSNAIEIARPELVRPARADALRAELALMTDDLTAAESLLLRGQETDPIEPELRRVAAALEAAAARIPALEPPRDSAVLGRIEPARDNAPTRSRAA